VQTDVLPDHEVMVANIMAAYARADEATLRAGRRWYPMAEAIVDGIAVGTGTNVLKVAHCLSALSPRNPWLWNIADTYSYAVAAKIGADMPSATTFVVNRKKAWAVLHGADLVTGPKVLNFVNAILGDSEAVVVDTWAARVALNGKLARAGRGFASFKKGQYQRFVDAYKVAAHRLGETPRNLQAITWLVAQTEGLASERKGRHDLTFKAGTSQFVTELVAKAAA
jgi:hypothetical protein